MSSSDTPSHTSEFPSRKKPDTARILPHGRDPIADPCSPALAPNAGESPIPDPCAIIHAAGVHRSDHPARGRRRPGRVGHHRPDLLAQGLQRRVPVRRHVRRSGRSDAGDLPQGVSIAQHVRPARELSDLAHQREPEFLHRSLPQRAARSRGVRARDRRVDGAGRGAWAQRLRARRAAGSGRAAARGAAGAVAAAAHGGAAARHPRAVVSGNRRTARRRRGHGQVAHQPRPRGAGKADRGLAEKRSKLCYGRMYP